MFVSWRRTTAQDLVWGVLVFLSPTKYQQPIHGLIGICIKGIFVHSQCSPRREFSLLWKQKSNLLRTVMSSKEKLVLLSVMK